MKKKIIYVSVCFVFFCVGVVLGTIFDFEKNLYTAGNVKEYTRENLSKTYFENSVGIPIIYNIRKTSNVSFVHASIPSESKASWINDFLPGQKIRELYPFDYDEGPMGDEFIYIDINDPKEISEIPDVHVYDEIKYIDESLAVETYRVSGHTVKEQLRSRYTMHPYMGDAGLCVINVYLIDVLDESEFPVARLRYSQNMCKPELYKTWNELRENLLNPLSWN